MEGNPLSIPRLEDPCLWIQGSLFSLPRGPFLVCRYQPGQTAASRGPAPGSAGRTRQVPDLPAPCPRVGGELDHME